MLSSFAALLLLVPLQDAHVSFDRVADVSEIVAELGRQMDHRMVVDPELAPCVVYVRTKSGLGKDVMDRLATALSAEWDVSSSPWRLTRHPALKRQVRQREIDWLASQTQAYLDGLPPLLQNAVDYERDLRRSMEQPDQNFTVKGPIDDLLTRLVSLVGPSEIAKTNAYEIRLFSNRPTASESRLPATCDEAIRGYRKLDETLGELLKKWGRDQWDAATYERIVAGSRSTGGVGRVLLSVYRTDSAMWLNLTVYGNAGAIRSTASRQISLKQRKAPGFLGESKVIDWPTENLDMTARLSLKLGRGDLRLARLLKPTQFDPLRIQAQPGLSLMANRLNVDVLVPLPDSVVPALLAEKPRTERDLCETLARNGVTLTQDGRWLSGSLLAPYATERLFLRRKDLDAWLGKVDDPESDTFRANATLAAASGNAISSSPLDDWYRSTALPTILGRSVESVTTPRWLTFFLGSLSDREWQSFTDGQAIQASSNARRKWLTDWSNADVRSFAVDRGGTPVADIFLIGSASFPNGAPADSSVSLKSGKDYVVRSPDLGSGEWMTLDDLASMVGEKIPKATESDVANVLTGAFDLGERRAFDVLARYSPKLSIGANLPSRGLLETEQRLAFASWPRQKKEAFLKVLGYRLSLRRQGDGKVQP